MKNLALLLAFPVVFWAGHAAADPAFVIGAISDLNGDECQIQYPAHSETAMRTLLNKSPQHVIFAGDLVHGECPGYSESTPYPQVVRGMWAEFDRVFFRKLAPRLGAVAPGNHDAPYVSERSPSTFKVENVEFVRFWKDKESSLGLKRVRLPEIADHYPYYWAYSLNHVLFIVLHSTREDVLSDAVAQKIWLNALLRSPFAKSARLKIAFGHVPAYPVLDPGVGPKFKEVLWQEQVGKANGLADLLLDHGVDLWITGHSHAPYPGQLTRVRDGKKIKILSLPCGHSPRKLLGKPKRSPRGFALLRLYPEDPQRKVEMSVKDAGTGKEIPLDYFPSSLSLGDIKVRYERVSAADYR